MLRKTLTSLVQKILDFSQNSSVPFHPITLYHSVSYVLLINKPNERCKNSVKFERNVLSTTQKACKKKRKKYYTSKVTIQTYQMENKMKLGQLQEEISKASLPVSGDLSNDFKSIILETDQRKFSPFIRLFVEEQQKYPQSSQNNTTYHAMKSDTDVTYQTVNLFSSDKRVIYFIYDVPHYI